MINIYINGQSFLISRSCNFVELIQFLKLKKDLVVVEHNNFVLPKNLWSQTRLEINDRIEFVTIVGGG
uniref:Thiamine biosynthesis protein ThiS n=1 Tax=Rhizochromulina marina TaxID=1034831 RepID=A0A514CQ29_9STRA|nr:thiamine biosynthesis protein ThiS [Rhizochromulina marina]QDH81902.1 thiamine biosynthesis protein ThiS [Rhizochromulina marina]